MNPHTLELIRLAREKHSLRQAAQSAQSTQAAPSSISAPEVPAPEVSSVQTVPAAISSVPAMQTVPSAPSLPLLNTTTHNRGLSAGAMVFNAEQLQAIESGLQAKSFCLIGAAGTGKTTVTQALITKLQQAAHLRPISADTKMLVRGTPGIVICGYTNKAVNNIRKKLPEHLQGHCMTIHKLIEFQPFYYDVPTEDGSIKTTMRFEPARNGANPLPHISTIIFEESSMIGTDLFAQVLDALPRPSATQFIFLGDLNQIPPVFGLPILGFKLVDLPVIELKTVYRQALLSPIISLATALRLNKKDELPKALVATEVTDGGEHGKLTVHPWKKRIDKESALLIVRNFLEKAIAKGDHNPEEDMILCPFNKSFGTVEINKGIADYLAKRRGATVFQVIARYQRSYWAVGDRVMVDRHEAIITNIEPTIGYTGKLPVKASKTLDRWGIDPNNPATQTRQSAESILAELDRLSGESNEEEKNLASHKITVSIPDLGIERILTQAGEINSMLFGYALTIHKSQGSEWPRVMILLHHSHSVMLSRELLYTAITRARNSLYIICEGDNGGKQNTLVQASDRHVIPGVTLAQKIEFFVEKSKTLGESD